MTATRSTPVRATHTRTTAAALRMHSAELARSSGLHGHIPALGALHRARGNGGVQRFFDSLTRGDETPAHIQHQIASTRGGGQTLQSDVRLQMESVLGADLGGVRLHTDAAADALSRSLRARAFTTGRDIYFQQGEYDPSGPDGRRLLAHEITHVVQQAGAGDASPLTVGPVDDVYEREADRVADTVVRSPAATPVDPRASTGAAGGSIQRMCASCASHAVRDEESTCPHCLSAAPRKIQRQPQQRLPPGTHPEVNLDPHSAEAVITQAIEALGDFKLRGRLTEPGNIITDVTGVSLGLPRSTIDISLAYNDRCNRAFQSALAGVRQQQAAGQSVFNFSQSDWTAVGRLGIRIGSLRADGSVEATFNGDRFQALTFALTFTPGVSEAIPEECRRPPDRPERPERPGDTPDGGGDRNRTSCIGFDCSQPLTHENFLRHAECCRRPPRETPATPGLPSRTVYFFYDTSIFKPGGIDTLGQVFDALDLFPTLEVQITGHTSLEGTEDYNNRLSRSRAEMARDLLTLRGIAGSRIHVLPMGEYAPAVVEPEEPAPRSLRLPAGEAIRDLNRRAEIVFFDPTGTVPGVPTLPPLTLTVPRAFPHLSTTFRLGEFGLQPPSP